MLQKEASKLIEDHIKLKLPHIANQHQESITWHIIYCITEERCKRQWALIQPYHPLVSDYPECIVKLNKVFP